MPLVFALMAQKSKPPALRGVGNSEYYYEKRNNLPNGTNYQYKLNLLSYFTGNCQERVWLMSDGLARWGNLLEMECNGGAFIELTFNI